MITLTADAREHFAKMLQPGQKLTFGTRHSGCSGLRYQLDIVENCDPELYRQLPTEPDLPFWVEIKSLPYLKGMVIDLVKEGLQSRIIYKNPNETGQCGCGESFSVNEKQ